MNMPASFVDAVIAFTVMEFVVLVWRHERTGRGLGPVDVATGLAPGLCLMIALRLAEMLGLDAEDAEARDELMAQLQIALQWLHSMDPAGVGARDLAECLCLQLRAGPRCAAASHRTWRCPIPAPRPAIARHGIGRWLPQHGIRR